MPNLLIINVKMVTCVKTNEHILNISLDVCLAMILSLDDGCGQSSTVFLSCSVSSLQHFISENSYRFTNMMASHHSIEFINAGTGTCCSTLASSIQANTKKINTGV